MKLLVVFTIFIFVLCDGYCESYDIADPLKSKALNPVKMTNGSADSKPLLIASNGVAEVPIVCMDSPYYIQVANLLKEYLDKSSGAKFTVTQKIPEKGRAIFVGPSELPSVKAVFNKAGVSWLSLLRIQGKPSSPSNIPPFRNGAAARQIGALPS